MRRKPILATLATASVVLVLTACGVDQSSPPNDATVDGGGIASGVNCKDSNGHGPSAAWTIPSGTTTVEAEAGASGCNSLITVRCNVTILPGPDTVWLEGQKLSCTKQEAVNLSHGQNFTIDAAVDMDVPVGYRWPCPQPAAFTGCGTRRLSYRHTFTGQVP